MNLFLKGGIVWLDELAGRGTSGRRRCSGDAAIRAQLPMWRGGINGELDHSLGLSERSPEIVHGSSGLLKVRPVG